MNHSSRRATELWRWILRGALFVLAPQLCACSAQGDAMSKTAATEMPEAEPSSRELDSSSETEQSAALSDATTAEPSLPTGTCHGVEGLETASDACIEFAELTCTRRAECKPEHPSHHDGISDETWHGCMTRQLEACVPLHLPGSVLDEQRLAECADRLRTASCAWVRAASLTAQAACAGAGILPEAEVCQSPHQCESARCTDGRCSGAPLSRPLYELIYDQGEVPEGPSCNNQFLELVDGRCELRGNGPGDACPCDALQGLLCKCGDAPCTFAGTGDLTDAPEGRCGPPSSLPLGASCDVFGESQARPGWCEPGTVCYTSGQGTCVPAAAQGHGCETAGPGSNCEAGLVCVPQGSGLGTCEVPCAP